jgi:hypothetical protein
MKPPPGSPVPTVLAMTAFVLFSDGKHAGEQTMSQTALTILQRIEQFLTANP